MTANNIYQDPKNPNHSIEPQTDICESSKLRCRQLSDEMNQCPYGLEHWVNAVGCEECRCYNPCLSKSDQKPICPSDYQCTVDVTLTESGETNYKAICKPGKFIY